MSVARRKPLTSIRSFTAIVSNVGTATPLLASKRVRLRSIVTVWPRIASCFSSALTLVIALIGPSISSS